MTDFDLSANSTMRLMWIIFASIMKEVNALFILGSILKHQEDTFATELHKLKQQPLFSLVDFENLIDRIRSTVAEVIHVVF